MKHINVIDVTDLSSDELYYLIDKTLKFKEDKYCQPNALKGVRVGLIFDANSLRTRISFEMAVDLLGGHSYFINLKDVTYEEENIPRERLEEIISVTNRMFDLYVLRDYSQNALKIMRETTNPPMISGMCIIAHPSQILADLGAIKYHKKTVNGLNYVGVVPSEGSGVVESFIYGVLMLGEHITIITETGKFNGKNKDFNQQVDRLVKKYNGSLTVTRKIRDVIKDADVLYVDEWWHVNPNLMKKNIGVYKVDSEFLKGCKSDLIILHCLPAHPGREISEEVMYGPQSILFDEAEFRIYSAMALLSFFVED